MVDESFFTGAEVEVYAFPSWAPSLELPEIIWRLLECCDSGSGERERFKEDSSGIRMGCGSQVNAGRFEGDVV